MVLFHRIRRLTWQALGVTIGLLSLNAATFAARSAETRFAIVSDPASASLEALLAARLSNESSIALLERSGLDDLLSEKSLAALGKKVELAGADYLIVLESYEDTDPPLFGARIVEASTGAIARHSLFPGGKSAIDLIAAASVQLAETGDGVEQEEGAAVALLGLRYELPQKEHPAREYALNQIIASALHSDPGLRVLERWQSEALLFERIARTGDPIPVEAGAILVDGTLTEAPGNIRLSLRLRSGTGSEPLRVELERPSGELSSLADDVVAAVVKAAKSGPVTARAPEAEAELQINLSRWAMINGLAEESVAAAETALALMPGNPNALLASIKALSFRAWPNPPVMESLAYRDHFPDDFESAFRLRGALQALDRFDDLERIAATSALPADFPDLEKESLRTTFDLACLARRIQEGGLTRTVPIDFRALQDRLRVRVEKLSQSPSLETRTDVGFGLIAWTTAWSADAGSAFESLDQLLKMDLGPNNFRRDPVRMFLAEALFNEFGNHGTRKYLPTAGRLLPDPDTRDRDKAAWIENARKMGMRESVRERISGYHILLALTRTDEKLRPQVLGDFARLVWEQRAMLTAGEATFLLASMEMLFLELSDGAAPESLAGFNRKFLTYILEEVEKPTSKCFEVFAHDLLTWKPEDAAALAALLAEKRDSLTVGEKNQNNIKRSIQTLTARLQSQSPTATSTAMVRGKEASPPQPTTPPSPPGALRVTRWMSPAAAVYDSWAGFQNYFGMTREDSGELWTLTRDLLIRFPEDSPDLPRYLFLPKIARTGFISFAVLPNHVAITAGGEVWIADKDDGNWWERVPLPENEYHLSASNGRLFMIYRPAYKSDDRESGILSYDPETREVSVVTSSRKESAGDGPNGRADWVPRHAFFHGDAITVAGELVSESTSGHQVYRKTDDSQWSRPLKTDSLIGQLFPNGGKGFILTLGAGNTIGASDTEQIVFFPADGSDPQLLARLANPKTSPFYDTKPALAGEPRWIIPNALCQVNGDYSRRCSALYHDGRLYLASADFDRQFKQGPINRNLHVFDRDGSVRTLPLDFAPDTNAAGRSGLTEEHLTRLGQSGPVPAGIAAGKDGLLISTSASTHSSIGAFWTIPYSDIEALLQSTTPVGETNQK